MPETACLPRNPRQVAGVAAEQRQKDVTMPFYFICLLHLCNEKTLKLEADGLTNFAVSTQG